MRAFNAQDAQYCLWKLLKLLSKHCVAIIIKYPFVSFPLICLFLMYICFPLVFWIIIYSSPLVVLIPTIRIYSRRQNVNKYEDGSSSRRNLFAEDTNEKPFKRVHSVRRRRAKFVAWEDNNVEEKSAIFSTSFNADQVVDKSLLIEEITKEVRDVEIDSSNFANSRGLKPEPGEVSRLESLYGSDEDEEGNKKDMQWTENDEKNVMDVGISEIERNKRLESLIARRKARKLLSLQVRKTLMNLEKLDPPTPIASVVIPKHNNNNSPLSNNSMGGQMSPGPDSAPSMMIRNPFDIPYDPQEEKPDLTGDSFDQEFISDNQKDTMFCRHESFSLGAFSQGEFNQSREKTSFLNDLGIRQRDSSQGIELNGTIVPGKSEVDESKSDIDNEDDQIKEIIEVHENNGIEIINIAKVKTKQVLEEDFNASLSSSSSSEEDDRPFFKIDKEVILHTLLSPARKNTENFKESNDHFSSVVSRLRSTNSLEDHIYHANRTTEHHAPSYSIASDMQVELLEVSENLSSYQDEDILTYDTDTGKKICLGSEELWGGSSHILVVDKNESRSTEINEVCERDIIEVGFSGMDKCQDIIEDPVIEEHLAPGLRDGDRPNHTFLHENISGPSLESASSDSLQIILTENLGSQGQESDSGKQAVDHNQLDKVEHIEGQFQKLDECPGENITSSRDSEERLTSIPEHEENLLISTDSENHSFLETNLHSEGESSSTTRETMNSEDAQASPLILNVAVSVVQSSVLSPNSVLYQTFSIASYDQYIDHEVEQSGMHALDVPSPLPLIEQSTAPTHNGGDAEISLASDFAPSGQHESSKSSQITIMEADNAESTNELKFNENGTKPEEIVSDSTQILSSCEEPDEMSIEETSLRCFNSVDEIPNKNFEAAHPTAFSEHVNDANKSNSSISTDEELSKHQEVVGDTNRNCLNINK